MINPLNYLMNLKRDFASTKLENLELETVIGKQEWSKDFEVYAAILVLVKRYKEVFIDPILFSQICLALIGIAPDFEEYEFPSPEAMNVFFEFLKRAGEFHHPFKELPPISDDLKYFIAFNIADDGICFVENELKPFQDDVIHVLANVFGSHIGKEYLDTCEKRWKELKNKKLEEIPEDNDVDMQIKNNIFIKNYTKELLKL